jgi:hypothetical protein
VAVLGIHTPETPEEAKIDQVRAKAKETGMTYPIAVDNAMQTWAVWGNRAWPGIYLVDKKGYVRYRWYGELNWKEIKGEELMRRKIEELVAEPE